MRVFGYTFLVFGCLYVSIHAQTRCGCDRCDDNVLNALANGNPCRDRIEYLRTQEGLDETEACLEVSNAYPDVCGPACHPVKCQPDVADYCGCFSCTEVALNRTANGPTCRERIRAYQSEQNVTEVDACRAVTDEYFLECGAECNPDKCDGKKPALCGCETCNETTLLNLAGDPPATCHARIIAVRRANGLTEQAACEAVAEQFPRECGPYCDPGKCNDPKPVFCTCKECTDEVLDSDTGDGVTCFDRFQSLWSTMPEEDACRIVSEDYPRICGPKCNPTKCDGKPAFCSCKECTEAVLDSFAGGFTCFERFQAVQEEEQFNEEDACRYVSNFYPDICGPGCHPDKCDGQPLHCGCYNCTTEIWNAEAEGFTCGQRILSLVQDERETEENACRIVAKIFPDTCGPWCNPDKCDGKPTYCDCYDCTEQYWDTQVGDFSCGERIRGLQARKDLNLDENGACKRVSGEFPVTCGPNCNPERCDNKGPSLCGCYDCDEQVWNRMAGNFTCLGRILALLDEDDPKTDRPYTEENACTFVSKEFRDICGPACHPKKCDGRPLHCGCYNCTAEVWDSPAGRNGATCGSRIDYLQTFDGGEKTEEDACDQVSREFPSECGIYCRPESCDGKDPEWGSGSKGILSAKWLVWNVLLLGLVVRLVHQ